MNKLIEVGSISATISKYTGLAEGLKIMQSSGLRGHIAKRHPECLRYFSRIADIISHPDYVGRTSDNAFELVKVFDNDLQIGIKVDASEGYCYVATLHIIAHSKVLRRLYSGRLNEV